MSLSLAVNKLINVALRAGPPLLRSSGPLLGRYVFWA